MRLKVIAALRAPTMATISQSTCRQVGQPRTASMAPVSANGRAKIECSNFIISSVVRSFAIRPLAAGAPPAEVGGMGSLGMVWPMMRQPSL